MARSMSTTSLPKATLSARPDSYMYYALVSPIAFPAVSADSFLHRPPIIFLVANRPRIQEAYHAGRRHVLRYREPPLPTKGRHR